MSEFYEACGEIAAPLRSIDNSVESLVGAVDALPSERVLVAAILLAATFSQPISGATQSTLIGSALNWADLLIAAAYPRIARRDSQADDPDSGVNLGERD